MLLIYNIISTIRGTKGKIFLIKILRMYRIVIYLWNIIILINLKEKTKLILGIYILLRQKNNQGSLKNNRYVF